MPSLQARIATFMIRRANFFGKDDLNPVAMRNQAERFTRMSRAHPQVKTQPAQAGTVPGEWLVPRGAPEDRGILYIHGGAWFLGSTNTHRGLVSTLAHACGVRALSINYRLAPEHPFPAGLEDCLAAYTWLLEQGFEPGKILLAGDSAGGNLALALLLRLRDRGIPLPAGAVALSPATDLARSKNIHTGKTTKDPFFSKMGRNSIIPDYLGDHDPRDPLISPLYGDLRGLPPILIHVGEHEVLLDDAVGFGEKARAAGVQAQTVVWPGMFHVFQMGAPFIPESKQSVEEIGRFVRELIR